MLIWQNKKQKSKKTSIWIFTMAKDAATNKYNITPLGTLGYPQAAPGEEEKEFLNKANSILSAKPLK